MTEQTKQELINQIEKLITEGKNPLYELGLETLLDAGYSPHDFIDLEIEEKNFLEAYEDYQENPDKYTEIL